LVLDDSREPFNAVIEWSDGNIMRMLRSPSGITHANCAEYRILLTVKLCTDVGGFLSAVDKTGDSS